MTDKYAYLCHESRTLSSPLHLLLFSIGGDTLKREVIFCVQAVISPLLANIYLHLLDRLWAKKCGSLGVLIRYADDFVVMSPTESKAKEALRQIQFVTSKLGLVLHPEKTRMVNVERGKGSFVFLGCTIRKKRSILRNPRRYYMQRWPSPKAMKRVRKRVHELTDARHGGEDVKQVIAKLNPVLRGWGNYFRTGTPTGSSTNSTPTCINVWRAGWCGGSGNARVGWRSGPMTDSLLWACTVYEGP